MELTNKSSQSVICRVYFTVKHQNTKRSWKVVLELNSQNPLNIQLEPSSKKSNSKALTLSPETRHFVWVIWKQFIMVGSNLVS